MHLELTKAVWELQQLHVPATQLNSIKFLNKKTEYKNCLELSDATI